MNSSQLIKDKIDIVDFIRSYVALQPAGKNFKANCPFHKEKTPSFIVSPDRQTWHCFGACSEGGDIFKFLMKYENLEFYEAIKILAEKAGVELRRVSPAEHKQFGILYEINSLAKDFFKNNLSLSDSETARKYLFSRGLKNETVEEFELGFSPAKWDALSLYLIKKGFSAQDIERAGVAFKNDRGSLVDRFRNRIMFPIYNHFGKVIGFSGRILPEFDTGEAGKYINSPETLIFNKSKVLYGLHKVKNFIREEKKAVLIEGQMDFLLSYQDGVKNAVATSGTALTDAHLNVLKRLSDELVFCFDNDEAGIKAAERAIDLANNRDFSVKIMILKDYKDPAEAAQKSPGALSKFLKEAKSAVEFYFERYLGEKPKADLGEFKRNIRVVLGKIKNMASAIERAHWLKELSLKIGVKEEALADEMAAIKSEKTEIKNAAVGFQQSSRQMAGSLSRKDLIAERLIGLMMANESFCSRFGEYLDYLPKDYLVIAESLIKKTSFSDDNLAEKLNLISLRSSLLEFPADEKKIEDEFSELLSHLRREYYKDKKEELAKLIKKAENSGNGDEAAVILKEFDRVSKLTHNI